MRRASAKIHQKTFIDFDISNPNDVIAKCERHDLDLLCKSSTPFDGENVETSVSRKQ